MDIDLGVQIERQPDYTTCGPTALHAMYSYYGDPIDLKTVIAETPKLPGGGHAQRAPRGACVVPRLRGRNVGLQRAAHGPDLVPEADGLAREAARARRGEKSHEGSALRARARERRALSRPRRRAALGRSHAGADREDPRRRPAAPDRHQRHVSLSVRPRNRDGPDDVRGDAFGHFIVLAGYRSSDQSVAIADPLLDNPAYGTKYYRVNVYRLIGAIFLGVGSDDGNLLMLRPKGWKRPAAASAS